MATVEANPNLGAEIVADAKEYVLYSWSVQDQINPIAVAGAEGRHFWDYDGKRYLDFASQLVNVNIGHQHPKIIQAIKDQADVLCTIGPPMANESRSRLGRMLAEVTPGDLSVSFFTNGGAEANENAVKLARLVTGRNKIVARYRSYHGATTLCRPVYQRASLIAFSFASAPPFVKKDIVRSPGVTSARSRASVERASASSGPDPSRSNGSGATRSKKNPAKAGNSPKVPIFSWTSGAALRTSSSSHS